MGTFKIGLNELCIKGETSAFGDQAWNVMLKCCV